MNQPDCLHLEWYLMKTEQKLHDQHPDLKFQEASPYWSHQTSPRSLLLKPIGVLQTIILLFKSKGEKNT